MIPVGGAVPVLTDTRCSTSCGSCCGAAPVLGDLSINTSVVVNFDRPGGVSRRVSFDPTGVSATVDGNPVAVEDMDKEDKADFKAYTNGYGEGAYLHSLGMKSYLIPSCVSFDLHGKRSGQGLVLGESIELDENDDKVAFP